MSCDHGNGLFRITHQKTGHYEITISGQGDIARMCVNKEDLILVRDCINRMFPRDPDCVRVIFNNGTAYADNDDTLDPTPPKPVAEAVPLKGFYVNANNCCPDCYSDRIEAHGIYRTCGNCNKKWMMFKAGTGQP